MKGREDKKEVVGEGKTDGSDRQTGRKTERVREKEKTVSARDTDGNRSMSDRLTETCTHTHTH